MRRLLCLLAATVALGDDVKLSGVTVVTNPRKQIELAGKVALTNGILEFIACEPGGREYESLVTLECKPSAMKFGLLLIGAEEGETNGTPLTIEVECQSKRVAVETWLIDRRTGKRPESLPFFFSGSMFVPDLFTSNKVFQADAEQAHIALWWQPSIVVNIRGDQGNPYRGEEQGLEVNSKVVPPVGTPVKLILRKREP